MTDPHPAPGDPDAHDGDAPHAAPTAGVPAPLPLPPREEAFDCEGDQFINAGHYGCVKFIRNDAGEVVTVSFQRTLSREPIPADMRAVAAKATTAVAVIRRRFSDHPDKPTWLKLVCMSARMGTVGATADPQAGLLNFQRLEEMLIRATQSARRWYIANLFIMFLFILAAAVGLYYLVLAITDGDLLALADGTPLLAKTDMLGKIALSQAMTIPGLALGVLFSGLVQNRVMSLETLEQFDPDGFSTPERLLYVWVVATTLEVLIYFKVIVLGIAGQNFDRFLDEPRLGVLIGVITALSTEVVVSQVRQVSKPGEPQVK